MSKSVLSLNTPVHPVVKKLLCLNDPFILISHNIYFIGFKVIGFCFGAIFLGSVLLNLHYLGNIAGAGEKELAHPATVRKGKLVVMIFFAVRGIVKPTLV